MGKKSLAILLAVAMFFTIALPAVTADMEDQGDSHLSVAGFSFSNTYPTYSGSGSGRTGSTTATLKFTLSDGSDVTKTELFSGINTTTTTK